MLLRFCEQNYANDQMFVSPYVLQTPIGIKLTYFFIAIVLLVLTFGAGLYFLRLLIISKALFNLVHDDIFHDHFFPIIFSPTQASKVVHSSSQSLLVAEWKLETIPHILSASQCKIQLIITVNLLTTYKYLNVSISLIPTP